MIKNSRLLVAVFLIFVMICSIAFADGTINDSASLKSAFSFEGVSKFETDITLDGGINITLPENDKTSTIDLNGHKLTLNGSILLMGTGKKRELGKYNITITDSVGGGEINYTPKSNKGLIDTSLEYFTLNLTIDKGTYTQNSNKEIDFITYNLNESNLNLSINDGIFVDFFQIVKYYGKVKCTITKADLKYEKIEDAYLCDTTLTLLSDWVPYNTRIIKNGQKFSYYNQTPINALSASKKDTIRIIPENLVEKISEAKLVDVYIPIAEKNFKKQGSLESGFPGTIEFFAWLGRKDEDSEYEDLNKDKAYYGQECLLRIQIKLFEGEVWDSSPSIYINGEKVRDYKINRYSDSVCTFDVNVKIDYAKSIEIKDQSPEKIEYTRGSSVELFVDAEGATNYQWKKVVNLKDEVYKNVDGGTSNKLALSNVERAENGTRYICELTNSEGKKLTHVMTLTLIDTVEEEPEPEPEPEPIEDTGFKVEKAIVSSTSGWAAEEVYKANEAGLVPQVFNYQDLTVNISRKEFAHVAVKLYEKISDSMAEPADENPFTDIDDVEVLKAYKLGITKGTSETTFEPDALITREQMATMMTRAISFAGVDTKVDLNSVSKFADDSEFGEWYVDSIYFMSSNGIIKGVGDNLFDNKGNATREAAILISIRSAEKFAK